MLGKIGKAVWAVLAWIIAFAVVAASLDR